MLKRYFLCLLLVSAAMTCMSKEVPMDVAKRVGIGFYFERINQFRPTGIDEIRVTESFIRSVDETAVYYIFNMEPDGYIAVSADDAVVPVLAYSFEGSYSREREPRQFTAWMKQYEDQIADAIVSGLEGPADIQILWGKYRDKEYGNRDTENHLRDAGRGTGRGHINSYGDNNNLRGAVAPLITSNWNQNAPYNEQCPADPAGPGGHTYAGCVPVCMGQLMYYYRWPESGIGSYSYYDSTYGTIAADFGNTTYEWNNMTNTINSSNPGIAKLLFHLGVSCDLVYGPDGSGMYNHKAAYALRTFFKYSPQTQYVYRDSTNLDWDSILIAHLDRKMPMYYAGWSVPNIMGHAFVCDGYQDTAYFHFNFGWSGQSNGYFYTNNLTPGGNNFKLAQEVIINAFPDTVNYNYPTYCEGTSQLTYASGSITDGSGPVNNYQPGALCSWLIDPQPADDSVSSITLTFNKIQTTPGDNVIVYDGATISDPVLGTFSGDTIPAAITGTKNKMLLRFNGNSGETAPGWSASYKSTFPVWCSGTKTIKADTAVINDGSSGFHYHNNSVCRWILQSESGDPLTIYFRRFDTEPGKDFVRIYDVATGDTLANLSGYFTQGNLPDSVTSPGGKMMLIFMTNSSITATGWEIYYPQSHVGNSEIPSVSNLQIFPNPARSIINVQYSVLSAESISLQIMDMTGNVLRNFAFEVTSGKNNSQIDVASLVPGIYIIQVKTSQSVENRKLVIN
jgi:hypothetical protein